MKQSALCRRTIALLTGVLILTSCMIIQQQVQMDELRRQRNSALLSMIEGRSYDEGYEQGYFDAYEQMLPKLDRQKQINAHLKKRLNDAIHKPWKYQGPVSDELPVD